MSALISTVPTASYGDTPWMEIDLGSLAGNWQTVRHQFTGPDLGAVVKCDAYGLGLDPVVTTLSSMGCRQFWVLDYQEGCCVRALVPDAEIFVLSGLSQASLAVCQEQRLMPVLSSLDQIDLARRARSLTVAVALDTGLGRPGLQPDAVQVLAQQGLGALRVRAWITQPSSFSTPEGMDSPRPYDHFLSLIARLPRAARSLAISASVFARPDHHLDMARVGSALYGVDTTPARSLPLRPVARLYAPVLQVASLSAGACIGYDAQFRCPAPMRIATLGIGYAHGLPYALLNRGAVWIAGHRAPIVAGVSMGLVSVDVTDLPHAGPGMQAEIFGVHQRIEDLAAQAGLPANVLLSLTAMACSKQYHARHPGPPVATCLSESLP